VNHNFYKFPSTPHLVILGKRSIRGDKVMSENEKEEFLKSELIVEEKVDGSNLGISFDSSGRLRVQNRGDYLHHPYVGQWKKLQEWLDQRINQLTDILTDRYILFGEWLYAQHSVFYDRLPDWYLGFDIYSKENGQFMSCGSRNALFNGLGISAVPLIRQGHFSLDELKGLLSRSRLGDEPAEGVYLRSETGGWLEKRAKLVQPQYIQAIEEHWSRKILKRNRLGFEKPTTHNI
jgi:ATP-dependent RNA circularization protein (DNA/RNA ligase family)